MIYVIFEIANLDTVNFNEVLENNADTLRLSIDGTKTVLKFDGKTPDFLVGLQQYNHQEILAIMHTPEWINR
tara:strand:- start:9762 stop:9977 length:216 start_codon:yes stop_codon:yes gene_type:complete